MRHTCMGSTASSTYVQMLIKALRSCAKPVCPVGIACQAGARGAAIMRVLFGGTAVESIRVIIAEDHAVVREGTRQLLEREHDIVVVGEAANGAEAVALVERLRPDVVIVDISMPVMSG